MMSINQDHSDIAFSEVLERKEMLQKKFFRECIKKTNQFSAQFVLEKMLREHIHQLNELQKEIRLLSCERISKEVYHSFHSDIYFEKLCEEYDLSTLTLNEASRIAIRIEERDLDFFRGILNNQLQGNSKKALKKIIFHKTHFIKRLKLEQARLVTKGKENPAGERQVSS